MAEDKQNLGPLLSSLGARRVGVDHWTEHDFEMERIGRAQDAKTYAERLAVLEAAGWVPFRGPFYYAQREYHVGHHPPGTTKRVPTKVAFAMFLEANPGVKLPAYKPHPHGWKPPPSTQGLFHVEHLELKPMELPEGFGSIFTMETEYGTPEEIAERKAWREQLRASFEGLPGVRSYGDSWRAGGEKAIFVVLEADEFRDNLPEIVGDRKVYIEVKPEAKERAEKEARQKAADEKYREETKWIAKARNI